MKGTHKNGTTFINLVLLYNVALGNVSDHLEGRKVQRKYIIKNINIFLVSYRQLKNLAFVSRRKAQYADL